MWFVSESRGTSGVMALPQRTLQMESAPLQINGPAGSLDDQDLRHLLTVSKPESFEPGAFLMHFGQAAVDLFVIESGEVEVLNPTDGGRRMLVRRAGDFLGDIDVLTGRPVSLAVRALGDEAGGPTRVLRVPANRVRELLNSAPHVGEKLITAFQLRRQLHAAAGAMGLRVIGPHASAETNVLREFLHKNFVAFTWVASDSPTGRDEALKLGGAERLPAVDCGNGRILFRPSLRETATAAGVWRGCPEGRYDFAIVGAGPAGLSAAVYAASEGLRTIVLDRFGPGGQMGGSSMIENFIGFPAGLSGTDLSTRGVLQMFKFGAEMATPVAVDRFEAATADDAPHVLHLDCDTAVLATTVLACTGVEWRRLEAENARRFERAGVHYVCTAVESGLYEHCDVAVVGAGNSAGQAVMFLADRHADRTVHVLVRRTLEAGMSNYLADRIRRTPNVTVHEGVEIASVEGETSIRAAVVVRPQTGERWILPIGAIFVFIGSAPRTDWLPSSVARDERGFVLTGVDVVTTGLWPRIDRAPCPIETSVPRLLAAGDLRAGSTKRVGFAVGDGSLAVTCAHRLQELMQRSSS